jgi:hypothetical protein
VFVRHEQEKNNIVQITGMDDIIAFQSWPFCILAHMLCARIHLQPQVEILSNPHLGISNELKKKILFVFFVMQEKKKN